MKYILLILGVYLAFSPNGICMDNNCCTEQFTIEVMQNTDCDGNDCHPQNDTHKEDVDHSDTHKLPQHAQTHHCSSCASIFIVQFPVISDNEEEPISSLINTSVKELLNRYSFSIWNPPNTVV